jgi:hypothetical protein
MTLLTVIAEDPRGFGRIVRNADGTVKAIVEEAQADSSQLAIKELNVGAYCFRSEWLWAGPEADSAFAQGRVLPDRHRGPGGRKTCRCRPSLWTTWSRR